MGPWLSSFGFVVLCMETNNPNDFDAARGQEALAALSWLTAASPVRGEVDPNRLAVMGHSMGGGGVVYATEHQPSLRAGIALAPFSPSQTMASDKVATLVLGGQNDPTVTPSYLSGLYATMPASTQSAFAQISGADHEFYRTPNNVMMKLAIPWLKVFVDSDNRYEQFLCPRLPDPSTISIYQPKCPYVPPGGGPTSTTTPPPTSTPPPTGACQAVYQPQNSWPGGFQGLVTVTAGSSPVNGWSVTWNLNSGQTITQLWSGNLTTSGSAVTVKNASYNGSLAAGASTTFGFTATGTASTPTLTCTSP
jgi:predicted esterase